MKKWIGMLACSLFLVSCNAQESIIEIEWVDFVKINGKQYEGVHSAILADSTFIGEEIGEVKFKVADHVFDVNYKTKEGDAAFWEKGTEVFSVQGKPEFAAIQSKDEINGYAIYHEVTENQTFRGKYEDIDEESINRIDIYKEDKDNHPVLTHSLSDKHEIQAMTLILNEGKTNASFNPNTSQGDPAGYQLAFYTEEPIAYTFPLFFDGEQWYWIPWDTVLLSDNVERFITEK
ncbi:hypothetical protein ACIQXU_05255 [Peribacillus sp. NPDC097284]|uniref:hypothetical protein n=1 Tax=unclassified Peribacillus TaxID=2675266 RepID=UPI00382AB32C